MTSPPSPLSAADVTSDGRTVWVNGADGCCLGRFSRAGIDVHKDYEGQMASGSQCLECKKGPTDLADWKRFRIAMRSHYGVSVAARHLPRFLRVKAATAEADQPTEPQRG